MKNEAIRNEIELRIRKLRRAYIKHGTGRVPTKLVIPTEIAVGLGMLKEALDTHGEDAYTFERAKVILDDLLDNDIVLL